MSRLQPGQPGWWRVFGARAQDIRPGDRVVWLGRDGIRDETAVERVPYGDLLWDRMRYRFRPLEGPLFNIGALQPVVVLRWGTRHTPADSI